MILRWKKTPPPTGLAGVVCGPMGSELRADGHVFARTQALGRSSSSWFWVARSDEHGVPLRNTCHEPVSTEEAARAAALAYVREHLAAAAKKGSS